MRNILSALDKNGVHMQNRTGAALQGRRATRSRDKRSPGFGAAVPLAAGPRLN
jgi:hypothetical protein